MKSADSLLLLLRLAPCCSIELWDPWIETLSKLISWSYKRKLLRNHLKSIGLTLPVFITCFPAQFLFSPVAPDYSSCNFLKSWQDLLKSICVSPTYLASRHDSSITFNPIDPGRGWVCCSIGSSCNSVAPTFMNTSVTLGVWPVLSPFWAFAFQVLFRHLRPPFHAQWFTTSRIMKQLRFQASLLFLLGLVSL
jgi:hypothetical protein